MILVTKKPYLRPAAFGMFMTFNIDSKGASRQPTNLSALFKHFDDNFCKLKYMQFLVNLIRNDMKSLSITLVIFEFLIVLSSCEKEDPIPVVTIPDDNFRNALIDQGVDSNGDGIISIEEAESITALDVGGLGITDLTGIEAFVNLMQLFCVSNQLSNLDLSDNASLVELDLAGNRLSSLDISNSTSLEMLYLQDNQLTSLDISNNFDLKGLYCGINLLTDLDVSNNTELTGLSLFRNQLTSIDVSNNTQLIEMTLSNNQLTSIDISNNRMLAELSLGINQLTSLDLSNNINLLWLDVSNNLLIDLDVSKNIGLIGLQVWGNQLTSLDISTNAGLEVLNCGFNQLTSLDISSNMALLSIGIHDMPSINEVCVWEMPFPPDGVGVDMTNSPNAFFTVNCTTGD